MTKMKIIFVIFFYLLFCNSSFAGKIVDTEWMGSILTVTYSPANGKVECTAYNSNGDAVGGGFSYAKGSVARVTLFLPNKYAGKKLKISCD
ncbi:hypothetical protein N9V16_02765 [SAR116 cluster bacterium]|nr:hypothetical protein [SAR116 cluster bacterium]